MSGSYAGGHMGTYGSIVPGAASIARLHDPSKKARRRLEWLDWYEEHGRNAELVSRHFGIAKETFYRAKRRYNSRNLRTLEDRSRRPQKVRTPTTPAMIISRIVQLRLKYPAWSKYKLAIILKRDDRIVISPSTVNRILKRRGLLDRRKSMKLRRARKRIGWKKRAEKGLKDARPGSLVQIDTKHVPTRIGQTLYLLVAVDCKTRLRYLNVFRHPSSTSAKTFLEECVRFFPFKIEAVQTDNGSEFHHNFHRACMESGIEHYWAYAHCPKQNGRVERSIETDEYEFLRWGNVRTTVQELRPLVSSWQETYNTIRPHQALQYLTPAAYYRKLCLESA